MYWTTQWAAEGSSLTGFWAGFLFGSTKTFWVGSDYWETFTLRGGARNAGDREFFLAPMVGSTASPFARVVTIGGYEAPMWAKSKQHAPGDNIAGNTHTFSQTVRPTTSAPIAQQIKRFAVDASSTFPWHTGSNEPDWSWATVVGQVSPSADGQDNPPADGHVYWKYLGNAPEYGVVLLDDPITHTVPQQFESWQGGQDASGHSLPVLQKARNGVQTTGATANVVADSHTVPNGDVADFSVRVQAKRTDVIGDFAVFFLRGAWLNNGGTMIATAGGPEVVYGKPTDAAHCTAGAVNWRAQLASNGTTVHVRVTGEAGKTIHWSVERENAELSN